MENKVCSKCGNTIEEGQAFCGKCGQRTDIDTPQELQSAIEEYNSNVKNKSKKLKKPIIISIIVLAILLIIFILFELSINGWSFSQFGNVISGKHFSCLTKHQFIDATCEHATYCEECGYEIGEKLAHVWKEATCTTPRTCEVCHLTQGKALGHSTKIGYCSVCKEYSDELLSEWNTINTNMSSAEKNLSSAIDMLLEANDAVYLKSAWVSLCQDYLVETKKDLQRAIDVCGSYSEFKEIKNNLIKARDELNSYSTFLSTIADGIISASEYTQNARKLINALKR